MKRVLAVLVNYGSDQIEYLNRVTSELKSFKKYDVSIIVNSNIELEKNNIPYSTIEDVVSKVDVIVVLISDKSENPIIISLCYSITIVK